MELLARLCTVLPVFPRWGLGGGGGEEDPRVLGARGRASN